MFEGVVIPSSSEPKQSNENLGGLEPKDEVAVMLRNVVNDLPAAQYHMPEGLNLALCNSAEP
jgi:hypothetical protein